MGDNVFKPSSGFYFECALLVEAIDAFKLTSSAD